MAEQPPPRDGLDAVLDHLGAEIPGLDPVTEGIVQRIEILKKQFDQSLDETLGEYGIDRHAYSLLGRLRAHGPPYRKAAGKLAEDMRLSSGAMTNRLDRMTEAGLIRRLPDPNDRRGTLVEPTEEGHAVWDRAVSTQARREALLSAVLTDDERRQLHDLLRQLMRAFWPAGYSGGKHAAGARKPGEGGSAVELPGPDSAPA